MPDTPLADARASAGAAMPRLAFIHGLRGIAAMLVVLFHLYDSTPVGGNLAKLIPSVIDSSLRLGFLGVYLFFVISGYVIALTLYRRMSTPGDGARFFARRQLRLDPPYWVAMVISIVSAVVMKHLRPDMHVQIPNVATVIAHIFYLQDLLGFPSLAGVFWTLCFEIQFYLFFVLVLLVASRLKLSMRALGWWMLPLYALSLADWWNLGMPLTQNFALALWFAFFLGTAVFLYGRGNFSKLQLTIYLALPIVLLLVNPGTVNEIATVSTVTVVLIGLLFVLAQQGKGMRQWLSNRIVTYLGTISYSLYLIHAVIGIRMVKLLVHPGDSALRSVLIYFVGIAVSIAIADVVFRTVEKPSMRLSRHIQQKKADTSP